MLSPFLAAVLMRRKRIEMKTVQYTSEEQKGSVKDVVLALHPTFLRPLRKWFDGTRLRATARIELGVQNV